MKLVSRRGVSLLLGVVIFLIWLLLQQCESRRDLEDVLEASRQEAVFWKDKDGNSRAEVQSVKGELDNVKQVYGEELADKAKEIDGLKRNLKNLQNQTNLTIMVRDTVEIPLIQTDTLHVVDVGERRFIYSDDWVFIEGSVYPKSLTLSYEVRDSIGLTHFYRKKGLFRKGVLTVQAISYNPNSTLQNLSSITIEPPDRKVVAGPQIGVTYIAGRLRPYIGVGVTYKLLTLR